jgi:hypothetical protein
LQRFLLLKLSARIMGGLERLVERLINEKTLKMTLEEINSQFGDDVTKHIPKVKSGVCIPYGDYLICLTLDKTVECEERWSWVYEISMQRRAREMQLLSINPLCGRGRYI